MINILDELVRVGAFKSKGEARMMIKNGGAFCYPCVPRKRSPTLR